MPIIKQIADKSEEMRAWRQHIHAHPEIGLECHETAAFVAGKLHEFGVDEIVGGFAQSGIVAIVNGHRPGPTLGLRADMDALPLQETRDLPHRSIHPGRMHACGHDGHTAMLLGAARYLAETRDFAGRVALIFQPGEEGYGGGRIMCEEGIFDRFAIEQVYALHTWPGQPEGSIAVCPGPIMAGSAVFSVKVNGHGGHAAMPQKTVDPVLTSATIIQSVQSLVSRNTGPMEQAVVSITQLDVKGAINAIPESAELRGIVRCFDMELLDRLHHRFEQLVSHTALAFGATAKLKFEPGYPATVNTQENTAFSADIAEEVVGAHNVDRSAEPSLASEDFAYMLNTRPGAFLRLGQGNSAGLHNPEFDFNDAILPIGASFFARLAERALAASPGPDRNPA